MVTAIAMPDNNMDPGRCQASFSLEKGSQENKPRLPRNRPSDSGIPTNAQPPHGPVWLCESDRSCRRTSVSSDNSSRAELEVALGRIA